MGYDFACLKDASVEFCANTWAIGIIRPFLAWTCRVRFLGAAFGDDQLQAQSSHPGPVLDVPAESGTQSCDRAGIMAQFTAGECRLVLERLEPALESATGYRFASFAPGEDAWLDFAKDAARAAADGETSELELLREFAGFLRRSAGLGGFTVV